MQEHPRLGGAEVAGGALGVEDPRAHRGVEDGEGERQVDDDVADADGQRRVEPREQPLECPGADQLLAEQPDRLGVGDRVVQRQPHEAHEREPVAQLVLGLVVGQRVERLQHEDAEHQHRVVGRPPAPGAVAPAERGVELGPCLVTEFAFPVPSDTSAELCCARTPRVLQAGLVLLLAFSWAA